MRTCMYNLQTFLFPNHPKQRSNDRNSICCCEQVQSAVHKLDRCRIRIQRLLEIYMCKSIDSLSISNYISYTLHVHEQGSHVIRESNLIHKPFPLSQAGHKKLNINTLPPRRGKPPILSFQVLLNSSTSFLG